MRLAIVAFMVGLAAMPSVAQALSCDDPTSWEVMPRPGTSLPPHPTIYIFVPNRSLFLLEEPQEHWFQVYRGNGQPAHWARAPFRTTIVSRAETWHVLEVAIDAERGSIVRIELPWEARADYPIDAAVSRYTRVLAVTHEPAHGDGYGTIGLDTEGNAAAYRLRWHNGASHVIPARAFHRGVNDDVDVDFTWFGQSTCLGADVDMSQLDRWDTNNQYVSVDALFADGSALNLGKSVVHMGRYGLRLPLSLVGASVGELASPHAVPRVPSTDAVKVVVVQSSLSCVLVGVAGALAVIAGLTLARVRRPRMFTPENRS